MSSSSRVEDGVELFSSGGVAVTMPGAGLVGDKRYRTSVCSGDTTLLGGGEMRPTPDDAFVELEDDGEDEEEEDERRDDEG